MKYNHYDIDDFLADEDFINWVKNRSSESSFLFIHWLRSNPPNKDKALKAKEMIQLLHREYLEPSQEDFDEVFQNLLNSKTSASKSRKKDRFNAWWLRAAILILVVGISYFVNELVHQEEMVPQQQHQIITKSNPPGQRSQIHLPDRSVVFLNSNSSLKYSTAFSGENREIELQGEAYFEVKRNDSIPFVVRMGNVSVKVLGTVFNANVRDTSNISISLVEGQVEISQQESTWPNLILEAGQKAIAKPEKIRTIPYQYKDVAWKEGVIVFENASLPEIKKILEQWYGVKININNQPDRKWNYNAKFKNTSLDIILTRMSFTERFEYEINNDTVNIKF